MKYFEIKKKYLAESLSYLGFRYYKFTSPEGILYSFDDTVEFRQALNELLRMKEKYATYIK